MGTEVTKIVQSQRRGGGRQGDKNEERRSARTRETGRKE